MSQLPDSAHRLDPSLLDAIQPEHLRHLLTISILLNSTLDLKQLLDLVIDAATELTDSESASILLLEPMTGKLKFAAVSGISLPADLVVPREGSVAGWIVEHGQPLVLDDVRADERHYQGVDLITHFVTRSLLGVPLTTRGRVIGVLEAINKQGERAYTPQDIVTLRALATQAAVAIDNARLFQQSDLVAEIMHELQTPLMSLTNAMAALGRPELQPGQQAEILRLAYQELQRLTEMTREMLDFARLESGRVAFARERVELVQLTTDVLAMLRPLADAHHVSFDLDLPVQPFYFVGDASRFKQLLLNLVSNGVKYNRPGGRVTVQLTQADEQLILAVSDNGPGIPAEAQERLFERFYRLPDREGFTDGYGLGLAIVKRIVEEYGGQIQVDSQLDLGTTFRCLVPIHRE
jgi:signal transduction histidine kinase